MLDFSPYNQQQHFKQFSKATTCMGKLVTYKSELRQKGRGVNTACVSFIYTLGLGILTATSIVYVLYIVNKV